VNAVDQWGLRPVHYAAQRAPVNILCILLRHDADPNALTAAADKSSGAEPKKLVQWDRTDMSPLMLAASHGREDVIRLLLRSGARATLTNSRQETALHFAAAVPVYMEECIVALLSQLIGSVRAQTSLLNAQVILPFQTQNFPISQILPSIDIWHLFGLISRIPGLHYGFFSVSVFFLVFS